MTHKYTLSFAPLVCALMTSLAGCSTLDLKKPKMPWSGDDEGPQYESPERIIAIWTDTVYQHSGKTPTRGFGGRIYFYNREGATIPVNGQLYVYAYDDSSPLSHADKPTRKYGFTAEQFTRYYSESELGASYNIWIPWDAVGNDEKQIALFPVFVDESGKVVRGSFANNRLPGRRTITEEERRGFYVSPAQKAQSDTTPMVQQAQYQQATAAAEPPRQPGLKTTTIHVPRSTAERMAAAPANLLQAQSFQNPSQQFPDGGIPTPTGPTNAGREYFPSTMPPGYGRPDNGAVYGTSPAGYEQNPPAPNPTAPAAAASADYPRAVHHGSLQNASDAVTPSLGQTGFIGADPRQSASARSRAWARQDAQSARFEPPRFRVPTSPGVQQHLGREPIQPSPATRPYSLPSTQ